MNNNTERRSVQPPKGHCSVKECILNSWDIFWCHISHLDKFWQALFNLLLKNDTVGVIKAPHLAILALLFANKHHSWSISTTMKSDPPGFSPKLNWFLFCLCLSFMSMVECHKKPLSLLTFSLCLAPWQFHVIWPTII